MGLRAAILLALSILWINVPSSSEGLPAQNEPMTSDVLSEQPHANQFSQDAGWDAEDALMLDDSHQHHQRLKPAENEQDSISTSDERTEIEPIAPDSPPKFTFKNMEDSDDSQNQEEFNSFKRRIPRAIDHSEEKFQSIENDDYVDEGPCKPMRLKTAEVLCTSRPKRVSCFSHCIYGYTYPEGITRNMTCKISESKWSKQFEECKPFIDCSLKLKNPGSIRCPKVKVSSATLCKVSCEDYDVHEGIQNQLIKCDVSGKWAPFLPFCLEPKGLTLTKAPVKKVHEVPLRYPK